MTVEEQRRAIQVEYRECRTALARRAEQIERECNDATKQLEARCLAEGGHVDDGGMFVGLCKRCGYCFG